TGYPVQRLGKAPSRNGFVSDREREIALDRKKYWLVRPWRGARRRGRQVDIDIDSRQRRCDHEDDEQHEHHVDEGRHVDFVRFLQIIAKAFAVPESHCWTPYSAAMARAGTAR